MLAGLLIGCMEYTVDATKDPNLGADLLKMMSLVKDKRILQLKKTLQFEEPTIEESVATEKMYANTSGSLYQVDPETGAMIFVETSKKMVSQWTVLKTLQFNGVICMVALVSTCTSSIRIPQRFVRYVHDIDTTALTFTSDGELIIGVDRALYTFDVVDCSLSILISIQNMKLQETSLDRLMAIYTGQFEGHLID